MPSVSISGDGSGAVAKLDLGTVETHIPRAALSDVVFLSARNLGVNNKDEVVDGTGYVLPLLPKGKEVYGANSRGRDDGEMYHITRPDSIPELRDPRIFSHSLSVSDAGFGYFDAVGLNVTPGPSGGNGGRAVPFIVFDGKVEGIGPTNMGYGYESPPQLTLTPAAGTATATIAGPLGKVKVTSAGSGYRVPPKVKFTGAGVHAIASCTLNASGGVAEVEILHGGRYRNTPPTVQFQPIVQVDSLTLLSGGSGYTSDTKVFIGGGGGEGAEAEIEIEDGSITKLTLTSRGGGYVVAPEVVFHDGGGSGAAAVATIAGVGSGATATAHINGSVIFCTHTGETSGLQEEPRVTVSHETNYVIKDLDDALAAGKITQTEYDAQFKKAAAVVRTRISGKVTSAGISSGGSLYGVRYQTPKTMDRKFSPVAYVTNQYQRSGYGLVFVGQASPEGVIQSLAAESQGYLNSAVFVKKPTIVMEDAPYAEAHTRLMHAGSIIVGPVSPSYIYGTTKVLDGGMRYIRPDGGKPGGACFTGKINHTGIVGQPYVGNYSNKPTVSVEDEVGTGAVFEYQGDYVKFYSTSGGSGYTQNATLSLTGGTPKAWSNKLTAQAVITNGTVSEVVVQSPGAGYFNGPPTILLRGGGGSGAVAVPMSYTADLGIDKIAVTSAGSGYTGAVEVVVVDQEKPFEESNYGKKFAISSRDGGLALKDTTLEFVFEPERKEYTLTTPLGLIPPSMGANFMPLFEDGYIESALWKFYDQYQVNMRPFSEPTVTPGSAYLADVGGRAAVLTVRSRGWANVYSGECIKEDEQI